MIKNFKNFVNENLPKNRTVEKIGGEEKNYIKDLYEEYDEEVYESLFEWIAYKMKDFRELFNDDAELINFIKFQLKSAYENLEDNYDIDSNIKYYCR